MASVASWAQFFRRGQTVMSSSLRFVLMDGGIDRCPSDLSALPMPVNMADVIIIALMLGMRVVEASFVNRTVTMHGEPGSITTSQHAILSPLMHFEPGRSYRRADEGRILLRMMGGCIRSGSLDCMTFVMLQEDRSIGSIVRSIRGSMLLMR